MRFISWSSKKGLSIQAIPETEEETWGYRAEGPYPKIYLPEKKLHILNFNYRPRIIHPDLLALLCILTFYPFCRNKITFPRGCSQKFSNALSNLVKTDKFVEDEFLITNIDPKIKSYQGGEKTALAFGGGIDSTATHCLFPEAILIHEKRKGFQDGAENLIKYLIEFEGGNPTGNQIRGYCIESNNKDITTVHGWTTWVSCASISVLMATDLRIGEIMLGSSMGSSYLQNGRGYFPAHKRKNSWLRFFREIGLPMFSPISGLSEIALAKIIRIKYNSKFWEKGIITWCIKGKDGKNCHKCWKCFRRDVIKAYTIKNYESVKWSEYNEAKLMRYLIRKDDFHGFYGGGPSLMYALKKINKVYSGLPKWLSKSLDEIELDKLSPWIHKHYRPSLLLVPKNQQKSCKKRIIQFVNPMNKMEQEIFEEWKPGRFIGLN